MMLRYCQADGAALLPLTHYTPIPTTASAHALFDAWRMREVTINALCELARQLPPPTNRYYAARCVGLARAQLREYVTRAIALGMCDVADLLPVARRHTDLLDTAITTYRSCTGRDRDIAMWHGRVHNMARVLRERACLRV